MRRRRFIALLNGAAATSPSWSADGLTDLAPDGEFIDLTDRPRCNAGSLGQFTTLDAATLFRNSTKSSSPGLMEMKLTHEVGAD
jgi:hypothetical protein